MYKKQWNGIGAARFMMDKVQRHIMREVGQARRWFHDDCEMRELSVELLFDSAPVICLSPVGSQGFGRMRGWTIDKFSLIKFVAHEACQCDFASCVIEEVFIDGDMMSLNVLGKFDVIGET